MHHSILRLLTTVLLGCALANSGYGIQDWNVGGTGNWFSAGNWTPTGIPNSAETANINNGGTASASAGGPLQAFAVNAGKNGGTGHLDVDNVSVNVQQSLDLGDVESTFTTSGSTVTSSGSGSFVGSPTLNFGLAGLGDINVGQTSAAAGATAMGTAMLEVAQVGSVAIPGDFDLGQTSGDGTATGMGTGTVNGITGVFSIGGDLDVGQTSGSATGINFGTGNLTVSNVATFSAGADVDVAQTTGAGRSTGAGVLHFDNIASLQIGDSLDVGKIRAFNTADNQANGQFTIDDSDVAVGFTAANPGSIEIARVLVSETARGRGTGMVLIENSGVDVANDVIVGELALGGTNAGNFADAQLNLVDSKLDARDVAVAHRFDGTVGSVSGTIDMSRSLMVVQGTLDLTSDATLTMRIDGLTRSIGDGLATDYAAIDADITSLGGVLDILAESTYLGPAARGDQDNFDLINVALGMSGNFDTITFDGTSLGNGFTYVGQTNGGDDGLFASAEEDATGVSATTYLAIPGDANGDMTVDGQDFVIWNSFKFQSGTDWSQGDFNGDSITDGQDFVLWNTNKFTSVLRGVPEPSAPTLLLVLTLVACRPIVRPR